MEELHGIDIEGACSPCPVLRECLAEVTRNVVAYQNLTALQSDLVSVMQVAAARNRMRTSMVAANVVVELQRSSDCDIKAPMQKLGLMARLRGIQPQGEQCNNDAIATARGVNVVTRATVKKHWQADIAKEQ